MSSKTTNELLKMLNSMQTITELEHFSETSNLNSPVQSFPEYIEEQMKKSGISAGQLIKNAHIQRNYGYQIINGKRKPGRDKIIALCLALSLDLNEIQHALILAREGILYPKCKRDSILIFCIHKHLSVLETNHLLYDMNETILN